MNVPRIRPDVPRYGAGAFRLRAARHSRYRGKNTQSCRRRTDIRQNAFAGKCRLSSRFRGEKIPDLEAALRFSKSSHIPLKFDNVMESFTREQLACLFNQVKSAGIRSDIGFVCKSIGFLRGVAEIFPDAELH